MKIQRLCENGLVFELNLPGRSSRHPPQARHSVRRKTPRGMLLGTYRTSSTRRVATS